MDINKILPNRIDMSQSGTANKARAEHVDSEKSRADIDVKLTKENINNLVDTLNSAARSVYKNMGSSV